MSATSSHLLTVGRATAFVEGWKALSPDQPVAEILRARRLLDGLRVVLRAPTRAGGPTPPIQNLRGFVEGLGAPLAAVRARGALIDVWAISGLRRKEVPNAAVLAWLIDPHGSHGQKTLCLAAMLDLASRAGAGDLGGVDLGVARVQAEERPLGSDRDRVDIVVETRDLLVFIEVKIDAVEGRNQLDRYVEAAAQVAAVRAVSDGGPPKRTLTIYLSPRMALECPPEVVHITWRELATAFAAAAQRVDGLAGQLIQSFARHARAFG